MSSLVGLSRGRGVLEPGHAGDLARSQTHGEGRTAPAASPAPGRHCPGRQARRAAAGGRDRTPHSRWHAGTRGDAATPGARRRCDPYRLHGATARDVPGMPCAAGAPVPGAGPPHPDIARGDVPGGHSLELWHAAYEFVSYATADARHGGGDHRPWLDDARTVVVSCAAAPLGTSEAARASFAGIATPDQALVFVTTVKCGATDGVHEHEKASKRLASLQAMNPATNRRYTALPPDFTRYKLL